MTEVVTFKILVVNAAIVELNCGSNAYNKIFPIFIVKVFWILYIQEINLKINIL